MTACRLHPVCVAACLLALLAGAARAQFLGGPGDGFDAATRFNVPIGTGPWTNWPSAVATGGSGDGFDSSTLNNAPVGPSGWTSWSNSLATGGAGDGFDASTLHNAALGPSGWSTWTNALATGGSGDGFDQVTGANLYLNPTSSVAIWPAGIARGGAGDGFDNVTLNSSALSNAPAVPGIFFGGNGDGFDQFTTANVYLDPNAPLAFWPVGLALGGAGDGFDNLTLNSFSLDTAPAVPGIFFGGRDDGFASVTLHNFPFGGATATNLFLGGAGDGFDSGAYFNSQFKFTFGRAATYNAWRDGLFTPSQIANGDGAPGADPDHDGIPNLLEYALGFDPRNGTSDQPPQPRRSDLTEFGQPAGGPEYLLVSVTRTPNALSAQLFGEASGSLGAGGWSVTNTVVMLDAPTLFATRDKDPMFTSGLRFMRLSVNLLNGGN